MPAPHQCRAEAHDEPSKPHPCACHPPQCYCDDSDPVEPDNLPIVIHQTHLVQ